MGLEALLLIGLEVILKRGNILLDINYEILNTKI